MTIQRYFLGANSAEGFFSCYDSFCSPEKGNFLWVIKGGPGCGKSSFMKKIGAAAEQLGMDVEYVQCSGDPDSVDGVYLPALKLGYVDGTAPHIQDVAYPAVRGAYLDLGQFYDRDLLQKRAEDIIRCTKAYKSSYQLAYSALRALPRPPLVPAQQHTGPRGFFRAVTCKGIVSLREKAHRVAVLPEHPDRVFLHPLWPNSLDGAEQDGVLYTLDAPIPDCDQAIRHLAEAKALHDALEKIYNPCVNFPGIYEEAQEHIAKFLL